MAHGVRPLNVFLSMIYDGGWEVLARPFPSTVELATKGISLPNKHGF